MKNALAGLVLLLAGAAEARDTIGVYQRWGAFRDAEPARCYAIARPIAAGGRSEGFASVATWPRRGLRGSFYVRLSRPRVRSADVTISIGDRRFTLAASERDGFAGDGPSDRAIVAALRAGRSMSVEAVGARGRPFADVYSLAGAATAIDAAAIACAAIRSGPGH